MAIITVYTCNSVPVSGQCPNADWIAIDYDTDWPLKPTLAEALENHTVALNSNVAAMNDFFTLSPEDVGLISSIMIVTFIIGNSTGKIASLFRKV